MKTKKILTLFSALILLSACDVKGLKSKEKEEEHEGISWSLLNEIAFGPEHLRSPTVKVDAYEIGTSNDFVKSKYSRLKCKEDTSYCTLTNYLNNKVISDKVEKGKIILGTGNGINASNYAFGFTLEPIVVYATKDPSSSKYLANFVDSNGNALCSKEFETKCAISYDTVKNVGTNHYVCVKFDGKESMTTYLKIANYDDKDNYKAQAITQEEYDNAKNVPSYSDGLSPWLDKNDEPVGYYMMDDETLFVYDKNKSYLSNVNLESYGMDCATGTIDLETKRVYYVNEPYYASSYEIGSEATFRCRALEISFKTGKVNYYKDFRNYIVSSNKVLDGITYKYNYILYNELESNGEPSKVLKCAIMFDDFSLDNSFVYDGFTKDVYKINKDYIYCKYNYSSFLVSKNERVFLKNVSSLIMLSDDMVGYGLGTTNNYHVCNIENLLEDIKNPSNNYHYICASLYDGEVVGCVKEDESTIFAPNGKELHPNSILFLASGIYVYLEDGIYTASRRLVDYGGKTLDSLSNVYSTGNTMIYRFTFTDSSNLYVAFDRIYLS